MTIREDVKLTAYALHLGFSVTPLPPPHRWERGVPKDTLSFDLGVYKVQETARGWRVFVLKQISPSEAVYREPEDRDYHSTLLKALEDAAARRRADFS